MTNRLVKFDDGTYFNEEDVKFIFTALQDDKFQDIWLHSQEFNDTWELMYAQWLRQNNLSHSIKSSSQFNFYMQRNIINTSLQVIKKYA